MNTLREIGEFIGIPQGSLEVALIGGPRTTSLKMASLLVTRGERSSMQAIIQALQNLTPTTLEAQIVGSRFGEEPFQPVIRLNASGGITWFTFIEFPPFFSSNNLGTVGGDFTPTQLGPGTFQCVVKRAGISNTGFVSLSKTLDTITVSPHPIPPPPPPPIEPPFIAVKSNGDGSFTVSGSKFAPNAKVTIRAVDAQSPLAGSRFFVTTADPQGKMADFPTGKICQIPNGQIAFSAEDGRIDPSNHRAITSNFVTTTCPG
jgi:hypothetical protein